MDNNKITGGYNKTGDMNNKTASIDNKIADLNVLYDAFRASLKGSAWKEEPRATR